MSELNNHMFLKLNKEEEKKFREWARLNFHQYTDASKIWHPVVRDEWRIIKDELRWKTADEKQLKYEKEYWAKC